MHAAHTAPRTSFPEDPSLSGSLATVLYGLSRFQIGSAAASRYVSLPLFLLALLWSSGLMPGRWIGTALFSLTWLAFIIAIWRFKKHNFVHFKERAMPSLAPKQISVADSIPIWTTGRLAVEGKYNQFTCLPGHYRTFATGEHAVLCLARDRRFLRIARWPAEDLGMWYAFFTPDRIQRICVGDLTFSSRSLSAVAIDYELIIPASNRSDREEVRAETLYLVPQDENQEEMLLADLLYDFAQETTGSIHRSQPVKT